MPVGGLGRALFAGTSGASSGARHFSFDMPLAHRAQRRPHRRRRASRPSVANHHVARTASRRSGHSQFGALTARRHPGSEVLQGVSSRESDRATVAGDEPRKRPRSHDQRRFAGCHR
jgi:hypothetical protein